jgi:hypothetical protein
MKTQSRTRGNSRLKDNEKFPSKRQAKRAEPTGVIVIVSLITLLLVTGIYVVFLHAPSTDSAYPPVITISTESGQTQSMTNLATAYDSLLDIGAIDIDGQVIN